jgi:hypothetical protein
VRSVANRLQRHVAIVRDVARILETGRLRTPAGGASEVALTPPAVTSATTAVAAPVPPRPTAAQVKRVLRGYLSRLQTLSPRRGRGAPTGHFVDHLVKVSTSYWPGLFHTYDHPEIPRTTNALERFFGTSKHALRCTTGRSSTAGGPMQSCGEVVIGVQALTAAMTKSELDEHLTAVSADAFASSKRHLRLRGQPARERRSIQRRLTDFLDRTLRAWLDPAPASRAP